MYPFTKVAYKMVDFKIKPHNFILKPQLISNEKLETQIKTLRYHLSRPKTRVF